MEIYYMNKDGVQVNHGAIAMLVHLISYQIVIISCGLLGYFFHSNLFIDGYGWIFTLGLMINLTALTIMLIGLFYPKFSKKLIKITIKLLEKFKVNNIEEKKEKINNSLKEYHESAKLIKRHKNILLVSITMAFLQMISYYSVVYFIYRSFGLNDYNYLSIILIQSMLFVSVSSIPLPGSVGISETVFLNIYETILGAELLASGMVLNRVINFYLFVFICSFVVVGNIILLRMKEKKE